MVIEGPNGVGKTTVASALAQRLQASGEEVHLTVEPTATVLGAAIRQLQDTLPPIALALSCVADRYDHITRALEPRLAKGVWVVCDRYVPSSLVLQRLDGFSMDWIWALNRDVLQPDLTVYLDDDADTITRRIRERGYQSRFERKESAARARQFYRDAHEFLQQNGWAQTIVDCRSLTPHEVAAEINNELERSSADWGNT